VGDAWLASHAHCVGTKCTWECHPRRLTSWSLLWDPQISQSVCCCCIVLSSAQGCQWVTGCHAASVEHREWGVLACAGRTSSSCSVCSVWWTPRSKWCIWLHGEGLEPRAGRMPAHTSGAHQPGILPPGNFLYVLCVWNIFECASSDCDKIITPLLESY
jgi:hypothetical protein